MHLYQALRGEKILMTERDYRLDNAKGFLIILVFYGHFIGNFIEQMTSYEGCIWVVINGFHMAAFLIISGYLSASRINNKRYDKLIVKVLIPYLFAQFGLFIMLSMTGTVKSLWYTATTTFLVWDKPSGATWYLFAIFLYCIVTSVIKDNCRKMSLWVVLAIAVLITLVMGYSLNVQYFRFTKIVCFYPYFLLGYIISGNDKKDQLFNTKHSLLKGIGLFAAGIAGFIVMYLILRGRVIFSGILAMGDSQHYSASMNEVPGNLFWGPVTRLAVVILAVVTSYGLLLIMPKKKTILSYLGKYSIYAYVLHWFIIKGLSIVKERAPEASFARAMDVLTGDGRSVWLLFPLIAVLCFALSSKPVRVIFRPFLQPDIDLKKALKRITGQEG